MRKIILMAPMIACAAAVLAPAAASAQPGPWHHGWHHGPAYVGPRGYVYRPVVPGYRFAPDYYHRRYWIADPMAYRLPPVPRYHRWVRYGPDVVRVDVRTGRVVEVRGGYFR